METNKKKQKMIVINGENKLPENCHFCEFRYMRLDGFHACGICHAIISCNVDTNTKYNKCPLTHGKKTEKVEKESKEIIYPTWEELEQIIDELPIPYARFISYFNREKVLNIFFDIITIWQEMRNKCD